MSLKEIFDKIESHIQLLINDGDFEKAENTIIKINEFTGQLSKKIKKNINKSINGIYFEEDKYLKENDIDAKIKILLENIKEKFGSYIIDELVVIKYNGKKSELKYFYSLDQKRQPQNDKQLINLKNELMDDMKFFLGNILQDDLLEDGEGTLAGNQTGAAFDIILRIGEYIFGFNNTNYSIDDLREKNGIDQNEIIKEVSQLYHYFNVK